MKSGLLVGLCFVALTSAVRATDRIEGTWLLHEVQAGETLLSVCERLCQRPEQWRRLVEANAVADVHALRVGSVLRIPLSIVRREPEEVTVAGVQGEAKLNGKPVVAGERVAAGSRLVTGEAGYVTLRLGDGSTLRLRPATVAEIQRAERLVGSGDRRTAISVERGGVEAEVTRQPGAEGKGFIIQTPVAKTAVRGTRFRVATDDTTRSEVLQGQVEVSGTGGSVDVAALQGTLVRRGAAPLAPRPLLPPADLAGIESALEGNGARIRFQPLAGARAYHVEVARDDTFDPVVAAGLFPVPEARLSGLAAGDYRIRVRGIDDIGLEGRDGATDLRLRPPPPPPALSSPADGAASPDGRLAFAWDGKAERYHVQVARDSTFRDLVTDADGLTQAAHGLDVEARAQRYFWRVSSYMREGGQGPFSAARRVDVSPPGQRPAVGGEDSDTLVFGWPGATAGRVELQLARDAAFTDVVFTGGSNDGNVAVPRPDRGDFFVRMRQIGRDGTPGQYSEPVPLSLQARSHPWWLILLAFLPLL